MGMPTLGEMEGSRLWLLVTKLSLAPPSFFSFTERHTGNGFLCGMMTYQFLPINSCLTLPTCQRGEKWRRSGLTERKNNTKHAGKKLKTKQNKQTKKNRSATGQKNCILQESRGHRLNGNGVERLEDKREHKKNKKDSVCLKQRYKGKRGNKQC